MNVFKKSLFVISAAISVMTFATSAVASASYPSPSCTYNYTESSSYYYGCYNYDDTFWTCGAGPYARHKNTTTSVYVNNTSDYEVTVDIWGKNEGSNTIHHAGCSSQANENSGIHAYKDENITLSNNGPKVLKQFIGERTLTYACVRFTGSSGGSGYWSPDTSGSGFPTINYL